MPNPVTVRYVAFTVFSISCLVILGLAGTNLSQTKVLGHSSSIASVDAFLLFNAVVGLLAVFVVLPLERLRPSPTTSKLFIEVAWISTFCVLNLAAAAAVTVVAARDVCSSKLQDILPRAACGSVSGLQVFSWLAAITLFFYATFVSTCARLNAKRIPKIWQLTVLEIEWTANGEVLPVLPTYREKQVPVYTIGPKPLLTVHKSTLSLPTSTDKASSQTSVHQRASNLITTPASNKSAQALYPHFFTTTQARPANVSVPLDTSSTHTASDATSTQSGRSSPSSVTSSSPPSPLSSPSSAGSKPVASDASSGARSGSSSPRTKHRPPPLNLAGLSAFDAASKSKKRQDRN